MDVLELGELCDYRRHLVVIILLRVFDLRTEKRMTYLYIHRLSGETNILWKRDSHCIESPFLARSPCAYKRIWFCWWHRKGEWRWVFSAASSTGRCRWSPWPSAPPRSSWSCTTKSPSYSSWRFCEVMSMGFFMFFSNPSTTKSINELFPSVSDATCRMKILWNGNHREIKWRNEIVDAFTDSRLGV